MKNHNYIILNDLKILNYLLFHILLDLYAHLLLNFIQNKLNFQKYYKYLTLQ